ncbi:hypothetical protein BDV96DRAFT_654249 [Lophiotrema nucula]|uniref:polynucleotide adenylyltransferase n=1 Tax=Lophiotrema nucula TaxID=690887 RepID=A0A6A5YIN6_9PLEO|nr:hypothetical protein BDV96DRAFT_654249 [Lophiotrema nucula]
MGDYGTYDREPRYLYLEHPSAIHSSHGQIGVRATPLGQIPATLSLGRSHLRSLRHLEQPPTVVLLHPLQLARVEGLEGLRPSLNPTLLAPPTVKVSQYQSRPAVKSSTSSTTDASRGLTHGNKRALNGVQSSASSMTPNGAHNMGRRQEGGTGGNLPSFPRGQRPSIVSQHSNSVPSTPVQSARQFESRSRSPSPNGGLGSHSPRSVSSEANGSMPSLRNPSHKCKYETSAAFGRRRIPYISSDILEKAKEEPKKTLDPHEDDKLSGDMRELYDRLEPTKESKRRRADFVTKLERILHSEWPGNEFRVHVFGSSGNDLYTNDSDVDICIQTTYKRLEEMHMLAEALDKHGMERVVCVSQAKVRIVKIWDPELELACDMNVNNTLALENTRMIKTYVQIDDRVRLLAMIVKHWTKQRILNDAALGGTISSYTWICMILNFLQTRDPPILPSLHKLGSQYRQAKDLPGVPSNITFADDLEKLKGYGDKNKESVGQLLFHFFRRYGHEIDYEKNVISIREGRLITREEKRWHRMGLKKEGANRLCVEEPFNTERNLGNSADDFAWRGIHLEIRRAFDLLADNQQLDKACEQYEYPLEEKTVFKKPAQTSKPVTLTHSVPSSTRGGRGGSSHRGGRGNFNQRNNHSNGRRASSGATFAPNRPFLNSPPIGTASGQEYIPRGLNEQLHDQLYQQYQLLEMQSNSLRAQLAAQQRAQQAHQVHAAAQMHAQAVAQAQAAAGVRNPNSTSATGSPQKSPYINGGRCSPRLSEIGVAPGTGLPPGFLYQYPGFFDPAQSSSSQDGSPRTNPSSPSLTNSVPGLRRQVHRVSNASDTGSIRSQSQPARGIPQQTLIQGYPPIPYYDPAAFSSYPIARSTQEIPASQAPSEAPYSPPMSGYADTVTSSDNGTPKEYVGYYVADPSQTRSQLQDYTVQQIPSYNEVQRRKRVSPEITQPLLNTALRRVSRSPSPLGGHVRSYSTSVTPPLGTPSQARKDSKQAPMDNGPVIVNGSYPNQAREAPSSGISGSATRNRSETVDALPSGEAANSLGIYVNPADQYRLNSLEQQQQQVFEEIQRQKAAQFMQASIANGSMSNTSPVDSNSLSKVPSGGKQPFPSLPESWMSYERVNGVNGDKSNQSTEVSPIKTQAPQWRAPMYTNGLSPLDTLNAPRAPPQEIKSAGLPLLSPVFETRTPSPTVNRQPEPSKLINGVKNQTKENQQQARRASHTPATGNKGGNHQKGNGQSHDGNNKASPASSNSPGSWQTNSKRRKKQNKAKQSESKPAGEPLPLNAADRKGG